MNRIATIIAALAVAASAAQPVLSQDFGRDGPRGHHGHRPPIEHNEGHRDRHSGRDAAIVGGLGLATGLLIGGLVVDRPAPPPRFDRYPPPPPPRWDRGRHGGHGGWDAPRFARPWTPGWYRWCSENRRFFDPRTGMFVGRDGRRHFCTVG